MAPLIMFKRTDITKNRGIANKLDSRDFELSILTEFRDVFLDTTLLAASNSFLVFIV